MQHTAKGVMEKRARGWRPFGAGYDGGVAKLALSLFVALVACTNTTEPPAPNYGAAWSAAVDAWIDIHGYLEPACLTAWSRTDIIETAEFGPLCERPAGRVEACTLHGSSFLVQIHPGLTVLEKCDAMAHEAGHILLDCSGEDPDPFDTDPMMWITAAPLAWSFEAEAIARGQAACTGGP